MIILHKRIQIPSMQRETYLHVKNHIFFKKKKKLQIKKFLFDTVWYINALIIKDRSAVLRIIKWFFMFAGLGMLIFTNIVTFNHFTRSGFIVLLHSVYVPFVLRFVNLGLQTLVKS